MDHQTEELVAKTHGQETGSDILRRDFSVFLQAGFWAALLLNLIMVGAAAAAIYVGLERLP
jgi:hypothetical protein